ncbi:MAG: formylmethanofuran--tetrahydromethanopterin N-formyltransferase, partial [Candidatus Bathyarchaeota archaeon]|nr:formylmethanofuran--tetrahydromethanopterin N-formyltransferase [Candidatus Bathyarchaeota archaeon]
MSFELNGVEIEDTFAEGFSMWGSRIIITAVNRKWANVAATTMTGFATSVIACDCEAGIEREIPPEETPDGRPG